MGEDNISMEQMRLLIGGQPVAFAGSCKIDIDKSEEKKTAGMEFPKTFECSAEIASGGPLLEGMLTYKDETPVAIMLEHKPKRIPRKIKKARRTFWHGTRWQHKADHWYQRNFYLTKGIGRMIVDSEGHAVIEGNGQWQDSRHPKEVVMSKASRERLIKIMKQ